jgi:superfamily I DNA/RNA helicase
MTPESCGGLEFDAVVFSGVDQGSVPAPIGDLSREGYLSTLEEAFKELYTAITRARFVLQVVVDPARGLSELLTPAILTGLLEEHSK